MLLNYIAMKQNINYKNLKSISVFRKIALGSWHSPKDPSTYVKITLRCEEINNYLKKYNKTNKTKIKLFHFLSKAISHCLEEVPELKYVYLKKTFKQRLDNRLFFQTFINKSNHVDLSGFSIDDSHQLTLKEFYLLHKLKTEKIQAGDDKEINRLFKLYRFIPKSLYSLLIKTMDFIIYKLNFNTKYFGLPQDRFGNAMISNNGFFNLNEVFTPLFPFSRCPLSISIGRQQNTPMVRRNELIIGSTVTICVTFDHRYFDGYQGAKAYHFLKKICSKPELIENDKKN